MNNATITEMTAEMTRRQMARLALGVVATPLSLSPSTAVAQSARKQGSNLPPFEIAQIVDASMAEHEVVEDFLVGSRAAWQDINVRGGLQGRSVRHSVIETDGSSASIQAAINDAYKNKHCLALVGTAGDKAAVEVVAALAQTKQDIAHVAPWLHNSAVSLGQHTFSIFADWQNQVAHTIKYLAGLNVKECGVVYASEADKRRYQAEVERIGRNLKIRLIEMQVAKDLKTLGQQMTGTTPVIQLFVGGTLELAQFAQGLESRNLARIVMTLADVNLQTFLDMQVARKTSIIAAQTVPTVTSGLPIVQSYRAAMKKFFDEPPTPLSLAGYISARYTFEVLAKVSQPLTRELALAAFQRRQSMNLDGYKINYQGTDRASQFVTLTMLNKDGRTIG
jgi:ABC-type branched-subunit amino acid transport system substrate-binding protein